MYMADHILKWLATDGDMGPVVGKCIWHKKDTWYLFWITGALPLEALNLKI